MNMVNHIEWRKLKKKYVGSVYEWNEWMKEKTTNILHCNYLSKLSISVFYVTEKLNEEKKTQIETIQIKTMIEKNRQIRNRKTDFRWQNNVYSKHEKETYYTNLVDACMYKFQDIPNSENLFCVRLRDDKTELFLFF